MTGMRKRWTVNRQMSEATSVMAALTLSGGLQDAYSYFLRGKVFANAQTGNIVLMGAAFFGGDVKKGLRYLVPVLAFAFGVFVAELIHTKFKECSGVHWRQIIVVMEIALLLAVGFMPLREGIVNSAANALTSFSCAMQVQAFRKVNGHAYASTMCIGNMRSGMEALSTLVTTGNPRYLRKALQYLLVIVLFLTGAGAGSVLAGRLGERMIWISCGLLAAACLLMFIRYEENGKRTAV